MGIVAVNTKTYDVFDFLKTGETNEQLLQRANEYKKQKIKVWTNNCEKYPDNNTFQDYLETAKASYYEIMAFDDFIINQKKFLTSELPIEIPEERFNEMLNILPPIYWTTLKGVEMFCMCEMYTGTYTNQYARLGNKYYTKMVDVTDKTTWIHNYLID